MVKINKKQKKYLFLEILIVIIVISLSGNKTLSLFGTSYGPDNVGVTLVSESDYGYTYIYTFSPSDPTPWNGGGTSDAVSSISFNIPALGKPETIPSNIDKTATWETFDVSYTLGVKSGKDDPTPASVTYASKKAVCSWVERDSSQGVSPGFFCSFSASFTQPSFVYGLTNAVATIYIPKIGYSCLNDAQCPLGFNCEAGNCTLDNSTIMFYRLESNSCSQVNILLSEKTTNDYLNLIECESHIVQQNTTNTNTTIATFYRLENNNCSQINISVNEKTIADYLTLVECKTHINNSIGCTNYLSVVDTCSCQTYGCKSGFICQTDGTCKLPKTSYIIYYIVGGILVLITLIFILARKKR